MIEKLKWTTQLERETFLSNDVNMIRNHTNCLKSILKEYRCNRNKIDRGLEGKINTFLHKYDIKREFFGWKIEWNKLQKINETSC